jgi:uncharacterized protein with PIN domain
MVDHNVGKLAKWLRMMGYDTYFFCGDSDACMIATALKEERVLLTRDTQIVKRGVVSRGYLKVILIESDISELQIRQVIKTLNLDCCMKPFTVCLECNRPLEARSKEQIKELVPVYVFNIQTKYMACPTCNRIYWRGTHWQAMVNRLEQLMRG